MKDVDRPDTVRWPSNRFLIIFAFSIGAATSLAIFVATEFHYLIPGPIAYDFWRSLQDAISIPGAILATVIGLDIGDNGGFDWPRVCFVTLTNGLILSLLALILARLWDNRRRAFVIGADKSMATPAAGGRSPLARRIRVVLWCGFGFGSGVTFLVFVLSKFDDETGIGVLAQLGWPFVAVAGISLSRLFRFDFDLLLASMPVVAWLYLMAVNGILCAFCAVLAFLVSRSTLNRVML